MNHTEGGRLSPREREELLAAAREARARGVPLQRVNEKIKEYSGGEFIGIAALYRAMYHDTPEGQEEAALARTAEHGPVSDFLRMAGQGATFGFADELLAPGLEGWGRMGLGALTGGPAGLMRSAQDVWADPTVQDRLAEDRQRVEDLRTVAPGASLMAEMAGAAAVPVGAGGSAIRARGLWPAMKTGARAGAVAGGLFGLGEGETPQERVEGLATGAATGGALGGVVAAPTHMLAAGIRALPRVFGNRPERIGEDLRRLTGVERSLYLAMRDTDQQLERVQERFYRQFDQKYPRIENKGITTVLNDPAARTQVRAVSREVANGERPPSFRELQAIRNRFKKSSNSDTQALADVLTQEMEDAIPGLSEANTRWRHIRVIETMRRSGRRMFNSPADEIEHFTEQLAADEREAFREGLVLEFVRRVERSPNDKLPKGFVNTILYAGPETEALLRRGFPDDASFNEFMRVMRTERRAAKFRQFLPYLRYVAIAAAAGGGYAAIGR